MLVDHLERTRIAYDTVAVDYARLLADALAANPTDRAVLARFAAAVSGPVLDVGCGPGRITGHLHELGLPVRGIDLSPGMVDEARRRCPELSFEIGSMTALDVPDQSVGGVVAWYSIIHLPPDELPIAFAEFARVLTRGGRLQLAFQVGDGPVEITQAYGHDLSATAYRLDPDMVGELLRDAGFTVLVRSVRGPVGPWERTPQAYLLARRRSDRWADRWADRPVPSGEAGGVAFAAGRLPATPGGPRSPPEPVPANRTIPPAAPALPDDPYGGVVQPPTVLGSSPMHPGQGSESEERR